MSKESLRFDIDILFKCGDGHFFSTVKHLTGVFYIYNSSLKLRPPKFNKDMEIMSQMGDCSTACVV